MASLAEELLGPQVETYGRMKRAERQETRMKGRLHALRRRSEGAPRMGSQAIEFDEPPRTDLVWRVRAAGCDDARGWSVGRVEIIKPLSLRGMSLYIQTPRAAYVLEIEE